MKYLDEVHFYNSILIKFAQVHDSQTFALFFNSAKMVPFLQLQTKNIYFGRLFAKIISFFLFVFAKKLRKFFQGMHQPTLFIVRRNFRSAVNNAKILSFIFI